MPEFKLPRGPIVPPRRDILTGLAGAPLAAGAIATGAMTTGTMIPTPAKAAVGDSKIRMGMPLLVRHEGTWEGTYTYITPEMKVNDKYDFRINVKFPEDEHGGVTYRQESFYTWPDGRTRDLMFEAQYIGNRTATFEGRISGWMTEVDERTLYTTYWYEDQPGIDVCEMIQLAPNGIDRGRTWHWFKDGKLFQLTLVNERRVA
ncbi:MAG: DUF3598 family protein [Rhodobacteraceae bacterium]|nr:DUF3598 family protein [Paracoccaceae bacterium]